MSLNRRDLDLGERGGFEAAWASEQMMPDLLEPEAYRNLAKAHLNRVYRERHGRNAPKISLNLASHQLLDDLVGWSKLNYPPPERANR